MPSFRYIASDQRGQAAEGYVDAASLTEAAKLVAARGLRVSQVVAAAPPARQTAAAPASPKLAPAPAPPTAAPAQAGHHPLVRTRRGSDKSLFFIFSQLAAYARSGVNPMQAAADLSSRIRHPGYAQALGDLAGMAREGGRMSDVFARYPDLFPPHVAGTVRTGEEAGALPESLERVARQADASHKLGRLVRWLGVLALMVVLMTPLGIAAAKGGVASWDMQELTGGQAPGFQNFLAEVGKVFVWLLPVCAGLFLVAWLLRLSWMSLSNQERRHSALLRIPTIGKRAKVESVAAFGWALAALARTGMSPRMSWDTAASAVPNLEVRRRLEEVGIRMGHGTKLSDALAATNLLPEEYGMVVETGEMTGGISAALQDANRMTEQELASLETRARARMGCWMLLILGIGSAIMFGILYGVFYRELIPKILGEG